MAGIPAGFAPGSPAAQPAGLTAGQVTQWPGTAPSHWSATPAAGMRAVPGAVADTPVAGMRSVPGLRHHTQAEMHGVAGVHDQDPAAGMAAGDDTQPPPEYSAVPYQVQALYPGHPGSLDDQAGWATK